VGQKCRGVVYGARCWSAGMAQVRQGNIDNGSTQWALDIAMSKRYDCRVDFHQVLCFGASPYGFGANQTIGDVWFFPGTKDEFKDRMRREQRQRRRVGATCTPSGDCLDRNFYGPDLRGHEAVHSSQWARASSRIEYAANYIAAQVASFADCPNAGVGVCNPYEIEANPFKGGHWDPPTVGFDGTFGWSSSWPPQVTVERIMARYHG
jgi:hypothetical protein